MNAVTLDYICGLKQRLEAAPANRGELVADASQLLNCSKATVYRYLKNLGWASGRKVRADCGDISVSKDLALKVAGLVKTATRANGKQTMPITVACEILEHNGEGAVNQETGEVTMPCAATVARAMRLHGCHPKQLANGTPSQALRSLHPNHVWQIDASLCVMYYLPKGNMGVMDERKYYKNKPDNLAKIEKQRVWRIVITDHFSGCIFARYFLGAEDAAAIIDTLIECIIKSSNNDPMHGVPAMLISDKGAGNTGALVGNFLKRLKVQHITHEVGNPRAKGQVEQAQNLIETQFEGRLRFLNIQNLEGLNTALDKWREHFNATAIHGRHKLSRNAAWLMITDEQLRIAPSVELLRELVTTLPVAVKVQPNLIIRHTIKGFTPQKYDVRYLDGIMIGQFVQVVINPYRAPAVDVIVTDSKGVEHIYTVEPIGLDRAGFDITAPVIGQEYKALPDTVTDTNLKIIQQQAYGAATMEAVDLAIKQKAIPYASGNTLAALSTWYGLLGMWDKAVELAEKIVEMNPACPGWCHATLSLYHYMRKEYSEALVEAKKVNMPYTLWDPLIRLITSIALDRKSEASEAAADLLKIYPEFEEKGAEILSRNIPNKIYISLLSESLAKYGFAFAIKKPVASL